MTGTKQYVVEANSVGVPVGVNPRDGIDVVRYFAKGETVDLTEEQAKRLLDLKPPAVIDPAVKKAEEERAERHRAAVAEADRLAAEAEVERAEAERQAAEGSSTENLTAKQKLVAEAGDLGLDTSGTAAELQTRIDEKKAADAAAGS